MATYILFFFILLTLAFLIQFGCTFKYVLDLFLVKYPPISNYFKLSSPPLSSFTVKQHSSNSLQFVWRGCFLFKWFQVEVFFIYLSFLFDVFLQEGQRWKHLWYADFLFLEQLLTTFSWFCSLQLINDLQVKPVNILCNNVTLCPTTYVIIIITNCGNHYSIGNFRDD